MDKEVTGGLVNVVPVLVGGAIALLDGHLGVWLEHRRSRKSLARAIAGEVESILLIIEKRQYLSRLEQMIALQTEIRQPLPFHFSVKYNYFEVFQANAGKIGDLPSWVAGKVVSFYTIAKALLEEANPPEGFDNSENVLGVLTEQRDLLEELIRLDKQTVIDLEGESR